ncbi:hypothetical protein, conserved [Trypanosoma brucei gambiense DAL972]|uniref:Uncharacterized protein n=2 Tax=Trypanosoma brucei TaxID=5691 RepID=D0A0P8_TRYB9|nr:hypothetical protein, conserved [Trypanosoma brucei gambiense DAL972]RHW69441.1 hypothetical protein DPX39_100163700 [Trypanosoma brucei equiperdum]CBH16806.1 hypothetical protein, conserved [Trypanosoma brucei gambiense DAL972]|eukprot:XP_011779070.1 hypothetical protein, conserved [Trypanosoma brucei gambiense DAL972]
MIRYTQYLITRHTPALLKKAVAPNVNVSATLQKSFRTYRIAAVLRKPLPPKVNLIMIDNTVKGKSVDLLSIVKLVTGYGKKVMDKHNDMGRLHPLILIVKTTLDRDNASVDQFVLNMVLTKRKYLKDMITIVLDAKTTAAAAHALRTDRGITLVLKKNDPATTEKDQVNEADEKAERGTTIEQAEKKKRGKTKKRKGVLLQAPAAVPSVTESSSLISRRKKLTKGKLKKRAHSPGKVSKAEAESRKKNETMIVQTKADRRALIWGKGSATDSPETAAGVGNAEGKKNPPAPKMASALAHIDAQEALGKPFCPTVGGVFQPSQQVERELFSGYVNVVCLADMLNLPVYKGGEMFTLYYRLTGAGAYRTPLITISKILEEACQKHGGGPSPHSSAVPTSQVPLLLLLGAPFLFGEDARLLCEEYQKSLRSQIPAISEITIIVAPACYTEKNILFALNTAQEGRKSSCEASRNEPHQKQHRHDEPPSALANLSSGEGTNSSLSENVLRDIVSTAVEEVTQRHEKSTRDLSGAVKQLIECLPRDRLVNLIDNLEEERLALLETTKGLGEIRQRVRGTQETLDTMHKEVVGMASKANAPNVSGNIGSAADVIELCKAVETLKGRIADCANPVPIKQQLSFEIRETLGDLKRNLQDTFNQSLQVGFKNIQDQQQSQLTVALREYASESARERALTEQTLRDLPKNLQSAMEKALSTLTDRNDRKTAEVFVEQQKLVDTKVSAMCDALGRTVEKGHDRLRDTLTDLLQRNPNASSGTSPTTDTQHN